LQVNKDIDLTLIQMPLSSFVFVLNPNSILIVTQTELIEPEIEQPREVPQQQRRGLVDYCACPGLYLDADSSQAKLGKIDGCYIHYESGLLHTD
jgi:hypothetical protein